MKFSATESGFKDGMGGASNKNGGDRYHYVLFGIQEDAQHPENSGIYFEYDDQANGAINSVEAVSIGGKSVVFELKGGKSIEIKCNVSTEQWDEFKQGIQTVFPKSRVSSSGKRADVPPKGE